MLSLPGHVLRGLLCILPGPGSHRLPHASSGRRFRPLGHRACGTVLTVLSQVYSDEEMSTFESRSQRLSDDWRERVLPSVPPHAPNRCCYPRGGRRTGVVTQWRGSDAGAVGEDGDALAFADPDDPVGTGCGEVIGAAGQRGRDPQQPARGIGHDMHVHAVAAVFVGVVGSAVAPVALGERAVEEDALGVGLPQHPQQSRRPFGQVADDGGDVGVGGPTEIPKLAAICARVSCRRRYTRPTRARWCGGSLQRRSPSRVTMSLVTHSTRA